VKLSAFIIVVLLPAAACVTVRPIAAPATFIPQRNPELVWVTHHDGEVIPVVRPSLRGDSLHGTWLGTAERVTLSLPRIQSMSTRQPDHRRTAMLVATIGVVAGFVVYRAARAAGPKAACHFDGHENAWTCN
jgi:hypothetical protein